MDDKKLDAFPNITFVNKENEILAMVYSGNVVAKKGDKILFDSDSIIWKKEKKIAESLRENVYIKIISW